MKKIKTRDLVLILIIIALAAVLLVVGLQSRKSTASVKPAAETAAVEASPAESTEAPAAEASPEVTEPAASAEPESAAGSTETTNSDAAAQAKAYLDEYPAEAYLMITTSNGTYTPIPLNEEGSFKINFSNGEYNIIHIGKNSFYMESSTCDNQNCVGEGEVTLENRDTRALYDMVLCLPHNLTLELVDADEALSMLTEMMAYGISEAAGETSDAAATAEPTEGTTANAG